MVEHLLERHAQRASQRRTIQVTPTKRRSRSFSKVMDDTRTSSNSNSNSSNSRSNVVSPVEDATHPNSSLTERELSSIKESVLLHRLLMHYRYQRALVRVASLGAFICRMIQIVSRTPLLQARESKSDEKTAEADVPKHCQFSLQAELDAADDILNQVWIAMSDPLINEVTRCSWSRPLRKVGSPGTELEFAL